MHKASRPNISVNNTISIFLLFFHIELHEQHVENHYFKVHLNFRFADSLNDIFSNVVFLQFALSSLILCVSAYETSAMKLFSPEFAALMLYLCCMLVQIFIYCFYGGELTLQSVDICDAVYRMDQSSLSIKTKKSLVMIMMRALRPITFSCGNVITVSLDSFNRLIKLSYSVYNVLQQRSETA
uniref:Odorant receptor n=1 Tax=Campoletis chlorideae TaxID=219166 RepID=A0A346D4A0_9HYME|nr:odorant receptor [Campoletis chlorideae]